MHFIKIDDDNISQIQLSVLLDQINITSKMDRIEKIGLQKPEWAVELNNFLERFPEFQQFRQIAPLDATLPKTTDDEKDPQTIFETIIYYVANTGVRFSYALQQFDLLRVFIRSYNWEQNLYYLQWFLNSYNIQPKKKDIYWNIYGYMNQRGITKDNITIENALEMQQYISGLGDGYLAYMRNKYTKSDDCLSYTDINFLKGFDKVYGRKDKKIVKEKCNEFLENNYGRVANSFCFSIYHHFN